MMSGCKLGTAVFVALLAALVLPLPLSNCVLKKVEGKTTEPGAILLGIFERKPNGPVACGVINHADLRLARPRQADLEVGVFVQCVEHIGRQAVRGPRGWELATTMLARPALPTCRAAHPPSRPADASYRCWRSGKRLPAGSRENRIPHSR